MAKRKLSKLPKWVKVLLGLLGVGAIVVVIGGGFMKKVVFNGCGNNLPNYRYSVRVPLYWIIVRTSLTDTNVYYEARGLNKTFTVSCTTQGVGGDICDSTNRVKFSVDGITDEPCFGYINGKWKMGVLNLKRDPKTQAVISFWAEGMDKSSLDSIFSTFKVLTK